jgi:hypothetical protein
LEGGEKQHESRQEERMLHCNKPCLVLYCLLESRWIRSLV